MNARRAKILCWAAAGLVAAGAACARTPAEWADTRVGATVPGLGSCMPGPCVPHGSVYPSPDTLWPHAGSVARHAPTSGYHHGDPVVGFSQFHAQGTGGHPSYGIVLVTPTCGEAEDEASLASPMTLLETRPYLFRARLEREKIDVRLSATRFGAVYAFTFPKGKAGRVVVNAKRKIGRRDAGVDVRVVRSGATVEGGGVYEGNWCPGRYRCFFHAEEERRGETVVFRIATSFRSLEKARANFAEVRGRSVDDVAAAAKAQWEEVLGRVRVEGLSEKDMRLFYSHLFHAFVQPRDRTGDLAGWPEGEPMWDDHYTLWDTWKTLFPLMAILDPATVAGVVNSFSARSERSGFVGVAFCAGLEYRVGQGGDESDNIVADAFAKGVPGIDWTRAYAALARHAARRTPEYLRLGYVPFGVKTEYCWRMKSGSSTLGFAYNDFCVAQVAAGLGKADDAARYAARAKNWTNVWDAALVDAPSGFSGFCRGRFPDGRFTDVSAREGFQNPPGRTYFGDFYEGSCWEYSFMVPGDISGMIERMGGRDRFLARLSYAFDNGLIDYGNEPSFITAWLFDFAGRPDLASKWAHVFRSRFEEKEIPGDDDDGAMGAMYVFLTSGLFPIAGQDLYALHAPAARSVAFALPQSGRTFTVRSELPLDGSAFGDVFLNGTRLARPFITHRQLLAGGTLEFRARKGEDAP